MPPDVCPEADLIIFDCDGTLLNSERVYNETAVKIFSEYGLNYTLDHAYRNWMGKALEDIVALVSNESGVQIPTREFIDRLIEEVPNYQLDYLEPIDGALEAVKVLADKFKICVASNGEKLNIISSLAHIGFGNIFGSNVFNKDDVPRAKPFPDLFLYACEKMGSTPDRSIVIEDSLSGIRAGRAANMHVIGFNGVGHNELQSDNALLNAGADIVFSDWNNILAYIRK